MSSASLRKRLGGVAFDRFDHFDRVQLQIGDALGICPGCALDLHAACQANWTKGLPPCRCSCGIAKAGIGRRRVDRFLFAFSAFCFGLSAGFGLISLLRLLL